MLRFIAVVLNLNEQMGDTRYGHIKGKSRADYNSVVTYYFSKKEKAVNEQILNCLSCQGCRTDPKAFSKDGRLIGVAGCAPNHEGVVENPPSFEGPPATLVFTIAPTVGISSGTVIHSYPGKTKRAHIVR